MVMAAGHGTRMRPLTDMTCKALVEVDGKALIDHMLDRLLAAGICRVVVNVHSHADKLVSHLHQRKGGLDIVISDERAKLLETGGGLVKALPLLGESPFLICNIDALWIEFEPVLKGLMSAWQPDKMDELFLLAPTRDCLGYHGQGDFHLDRQGRISFNGPTMRPYVYAGIEIFKPELAYGFECEPFSRTQIWNPVFAHKGACGYVMNGYWMHVGDPDARKAAEIVMKQARSDG